MFGGLYAESESELGGLLSPAQFVVAGFCCMCVFESESFFGDLYMGSAVAAGGGSDKSGSLQMSPREDLSSCFPESESLLGDLHVGPLAATCDSTSTWMRRLLALRVRNVSSGEFVGV
jgi:hypothetical protein